MNNHFDFSARYITDDFSARQHHNNIKPDMLHNSETLFEDFYRQLTAPKLLLAESHNFVNYMKQQSSYSANNTLPQDLIYPDGTQNAMQPLELLRADLEQSYQNTTYELQNAQAQTIHPQTAEPMLDRNAEMWQRQQREQQLVEQQVNTESREQSRTPEKTQAITAERAESQSKLDKPKLSHSENMLATELMVNRQAKVPSENNKNYNKHLTAQGKEKGSETQRPLASASSKVPENQVQESQGEVQNNSNKKSGPEIQVIDERQAAKKSKHFSGAGQLQKQQVALKGLAQNSNLKEPASQTTKETETSGENHQAKAAPKGVTLKELGNNFAKKSAERQLRTKVQTDTKPSALKQTAQQREPKTESQNASAKNEMPHQKQLEQLGKFGQLAASSNEKPQKNSRSREVQTTLAAMAKNGAQNEPVKSNSQNRAEALSKNLGRVAKLRRRNSQGMQYTALIDKPNVQNGQGNSAGSNFEPNFGKYSNSKFDVTPRESAGGHNTFANSSPTGFSGTIAGSPLRSLAQQMAQRLMEGPLAENLRQLQFRLLDQNRGEIRLRLNPESLGQVRIHLNIDGNQLNGRIVADSAETARMLQDNIQQLEASLREGGFENQRLNVSVGGGQTENAEDRQLAGGFASGRLQLPENERDAENWEELDSSGELGILQEPSQINYSV